MRPTPVLASVFTVLAVAALSACSPSPTTTYTDVHGQQVTVDWEDYPGDSYHSPEQVLAAPGPAQIERAGADLLTDLQQALTAQGIRGWRTSDTRYWDSLGNDYGGDSLYLTYSSPYLESRALPADPADWHQVLDAVSAVAVAHSFTAAELDHDAAERSGNTRQLREMREVFGTDDPDRFWEWAATATKGTQWLTVDLVDVDRDASGDAARDATRYHWPKRSVTFQYGATTIPASQRAAFTQRLAPFTGLERPPALPNSILSD